MLEFTKPVLPGGIAVLMIWATVGPPYPFWTATLSRPYSMAWRTPSLPIAPPVFGLRRLNTTYGNVLLSGQILNFGSRVARRRGIAVGSNGVSPPTRS